MRLTSRIALYCVFLLACASPAVAQVTGLSADPCGDPTVESDAWTVVRGNVVKVMDGDTVTVVLKNRKRIRVQLIGLAAPELKQPFGRSSRLLLESLVLHKVVVILVSDSQYSLLRHSQAKELTGVINLPNIELDVNLLMLQAGMARHRQGADYSMSANAECHYRRAADESRAARRGLWRG